MIKSRRKGKGYLAALIGGVSGAATLFAFSLFLSGAFLSLYTNLAEPKQSVIVTYAVITGIGVGEVLGCFLALCWRRHQSAGRTAAWLLALLIPGLLLFLVMRVVTGWLVAAILTIISLPLLARALTNYPNYPGYLQKMLHVFAKRPPNF
ncbi:hypothetical protein [Iningainema tapete]|uniref:Uncharacterized protein n=1 Tax=Iningainema tapete BLCC-T55 TaxID=2748662 RepID=A0A8J6Y0B9_9CYAN|nr:hypothetical protein [Iningainema tapete]MBD2776713.1 hypothetical protein [Iningainema tapete BLCC-T55]